MFNIRRNKKEEENGKNYRADLSEFMAKRSIEDKNGLIEDIISENSFMQREEKMRKLAESILKEEFSEEIKNMKSYDILLDAIINKLKKDELGEVEKISEEE